MADELIYHYTDLTGLLGILESKELWATDVRYLNDASEATYGEERLRELVARDLSGRFPRPEAANVFGRVWKNFTVQAPRSFVACFCKEGDLLSQWRGYGRLGYAIGFDREVLQRLAGECGFIVRDVVYNKAEQQGLVTEVLNQFVANFPVRAVRAGAAGDESSIQGAMIWGVTYASDLYELVPKLKHEAFGEEKEVRAIHRCMQGCASEVRVRPSGLGPAPYVAFGVGTDPETTAIRRIRVGPNPHVSEASEGVRDLLKWRGLPGVEVAVSSVPFRVVAG